MPMPISINAAVKYGASQVGQLCRTGRDWHFSYNGEHKSGAWTWSHPRPFFPANNQRKATSAYHAALAWYRTNRSETNPDAVTDDAHEFALLVEQFALEPNVSPRAALEKGIAKASR